MHVFGLTVIIFVVLGCNYMNLAVFLTSKKLTSFPTTRLIVSYIAELQVSSQKKKKIIVKVLVD